MAEKNQNTMILSIHKIIIPEEFKELPPRKEKVEEKIAYYRKYRDFDKPVTVKETEDGNYTLTDGYSDLLLLKN